MSLQNFQCFSVNWRFPAGNHGDARSICAALFHASLSQMISRHTFKTVHGDSALFCPNFVPRCDPNKREFEPHFSTIFFFFTMTIYRDFSVVTVIHSKWGISIFSSWVLYCQVSILHLSLVSFKLPFILVFKIPMSGKVWMGCSFSKVLESEGQKRD